MLSGNIDEERKSTNKVAASAAKMGEEGTEEQGRREESQFNDRHVAHSLDNFGLEDQFLNFLTLWDDWNNHTTPG